MPNSTTRLGLTIPVGTDAPSELRVAIANNAGITDAAALFFTGTLLGRDTTVDPSPVRGHVYYATDSNQWFVYTGTAWQIIIVAGTWFSLTLPTNIVTPVGYRVPQSRQEGDVVRLKGAIRNNTGSDIAAGQTLATIPNPTRPGAIVLTQMADSTGTVFPAQVATTGIITIAGTFTAGHILSMENLGYFWP